MNKLFWDRREKPVDYVVTFVHRGIPGDKRTISVAQVIDVRGSFFTYESEGGETTIPFHRVIELVNTTSGEVLWKSRRRDSD